MYKLTLYHDKSRTRVSLSQEKLEILVENFGVFSSFFSLTKFDKRKVHNHDHAGVKWGAT